ncbi:hypothetical protein D3C81_2066660 [compost metagenome]
MRGKHIIPCCILDAGKLILSSYLAEWHNLQAVFLPACGVHKQIFKCTTTARVLQ